MFLIAELGNTAYKREMVSVAPSIPSSSSCMYRATGKVINEQPLAHRLVLKGYVSCSRKDIQLGFNFKYFLGNEVRVWFLN